MTMANPTNLPGDLIVPGDVRITGEISPALAREDCLAITELAVFPIKLTDFRKFDDMAVVLPSAGLTDDLGLIEGSVTVGTTSLQTENLATLGATTHNARVIVHLPWCYVDGNTATLRFHAGMLTTAADNTATLDCIVYKNIADLNNDAIGSDLVTIGAQTINSTTFANIDFPLTASGLVAGDVLDVVIQTAVNDAASGTTVIAAITSAHLLCDVR
jgi:hypothetical protein